MQGSADAVSFTEGMDETDFLADLKTQRAVVMRLMIVGGAASRIFSDYPDFAEANDSVPWRSIRGMRNRIAHGYFDIDLHVVWQTASELPHCPTRTLKHIAFNRGSDPVRDCSTESQVLLKTQITAWHACREPDTVIGAEKFTPVSMHRRRIDAQHHGTAMPPANKLCSVSVR